MTPWIAAVVEVVDTADGWWTGTVRDLLCDTTARVPPARRDPSWPRTPRAAGAYLRKAAEDLRRTAQIEMLLGVRRGRNRTRMIILSRPRVITLAKDPPPLQTVLGPYSRA
jgi:hypothetical protein